MVMQDQAWNGFAAGEWQRSIDVRSFIQKNWTPYLGDDAFLAGPTQRTKAVWKRCEELLLRELKDGILDVDTHRVSGIDNYAPGYIDRENEVIVGLQTDAPLKRIVNLYGGTRMAKSALEQYGYQLDPEIEAHFTEYRKTHNEGVFDAYPERTRAARHAGLLTGLPDAYGRGRIIGDYRRVALYGVDRLIEWKKRDLEELDGPMGEERIRLREEVSEQIRALGKMKDMASRYGVDLSRPAANAHDAIQALYMAYLAGIKENNGAATSLGRTSTFVDIYLQRDLENGVITEEEAQELSMPVLDERLFKSPAVALQQAKNAVVKMSRRAARNVGLATPLLLKMDEDVVSAIDVRENLIDRMEVDISNYLIKLADQELGDAESHEVTELLNFVTECERIGDYAVNIKEKAQELTDKEVTFSEKAQQELKLLDNALEKILTLTTDAFEFDDARTASQVEPLEQVIDILVERLRAQHIKRLKDGACSIDTGVVYLDVLNNVERISDHCSNIAARLVGMEAGEDYDSHTLKNMMHHNPTKEYMLNYEQCRKDYLIPLEQLEA